MRLPIKGALELDLILLIVLCLLIFGGGVLVGTYLAGNRSDLPQV